MEDNGAEKFASGLMDHYETPLKRVKEQLSDLNTRQSTVLNEIEEENKKFGSVNIPEVNDLFKAVKEYQIRLMNVKKDMYLIAEKSSQIKKRALRLQEIKQNEALEKAHSREAQLRKEEELIARPKNKPDSKK